MYKVVLLFPTEDDAANFCAYWSDGGGEDGFLDIPSSSGILHCDYSRCFPAWGYDPQEHGPDRTIVFQTREDCDV